MGTLELCKNQNKQRSCRLHQRTDVTDECGPSPTPNLWPAVEKNAYYFEVGNWRDTRSQLVAYPKNVGFFTIIHHMRKSFTLFLWQPCLVMI
jgi:hypothetical protein